MDLHTLDDCINGLKKARDVCSSQLDIGALKELDGAVAGLEMFREHPRSTAEAAMLTVRVLEGIAAVVKITTSLSDFL